MIRGVNKMKCEKCLYRKNCQFIAKDYKVPTYACECTAFESEEEFKAKVKFEAIKEFAERLKAISHPYAPAHTQVIFESQIDNLVKEMGCD